MPFISKDWRSPGEHWVKIGPGWERAKVISYLNSGEFKEGDGKSDESSQQPRYNVTTRTSKEIRKQNSLSEALLQLDFYSACHNIRRFNYTCRMIQLLLFNMNYLPGNVQRILIRLIEEMAAYSKENGWKGEMRNILELMRENIVNQPVWGGQLGSTKLWEEHRNNIQKILNATAEEDFDRNKGPPILHFPEEVIRQILLKLSSDKDIDSLSNTHLIFKDIGNENRVWRQLCNYHFTAAQKEQVIQQQNNNFGNNNSSSFYRKSVNNHKNNNNLNRVNTTDDCNSDGGSGSGSDDGGDDDVKTTPSSPPLSHRCIHTNFAEDSPQWKIMYKALKRKHGLNKEEYAEELNLCKTCGLLFWTTSSSNPHDCGMAILIRVKPGDFIKYFCV